MKSVRGARNKKMYRDIRDHRACSATLTGTPMSAPRCSFDGYRHWYPGNLFRAAAQLRHKGITITLATRCYNYVNYQTEGSYQKHNSSFAIRSWNRKLPISECDYYRGQFCINKTDCWQIVSEIAVIERFNFYCFDTNIPNRSEFH